MDYRKTDGYAKYLNDNNVNDKKLVLSFCGILATPCLLILRFVYQMLLPLLLMRLLILCLCGILLVVRVSNGCK